MQFFDDLIVSSGFNLKKIAKVNSFNTSIIALVFSVSCVVVIGLLEQRIVKPLPESFRKLRQYEIFDKQLFYTPASVKETLDQWGDRGILIYYVIEIFDVLVFCTAYRLLYVTVLNNLLASVRKSISPKFFDQIYSLVFLPMAITIIDYFEDGAQMIMCYMYQNRNAGSLWQRLVYLSSTLNFIKWTTVAIACFCCDHTLFEKQKIKLKVGFETFLL